MTPEREKAFEAYVAALRAAFESHGDAVIRVAVTPAGSDKPVAFALVVGHQDLNENGRMLLLSQLFREMSPPQTVGFGPMPLTEKPRWVTARESGVSPSTRIPFVTLNEQARDEETAIEVLRASGFEIGDHGEGGFDGKR